MLPWDLTALLQSYQLPSGGKVVQLDMHNGLHVEPVLEPLLLIVHVERHEVGEAPGDCAVIITARGNR